MEIRKEKDSNLITDLTLGLVDALGAFPGVRDINVCIRPGAERATLAAWEQRHGVTLPVALKQLYSATDGFSLTWNFTIAGKILPIGNLEIHPISRLNRVGSGRTSGDPLAPSLTDLILAEEVIPSAGSSTTEGPTQEGQSYHYLPIDQSLVCKNKSKGPPPPSFHLSKLFEIDNVQGHGKVVLAYPGRGESFAEGSFWFIDLSLRMHLLATDAATYWRMMLVHLGMPQWQALVVGLGLTPWAKQWYELLAPHLLDGGIRQHKTPQPDLINKLDWSVFKGKKTNKSKSTKETPKLAKDPTSENTKREKREK